MSGRHWDQPFDSLGEFYGKVYGQHLREVRRLGSTGATFLEAAQSAGDWSDAPTPDLAIGWLPTRPVGFSCDLGAGRFRGTQRRNDAILVGPGAGTSIQMEGAHVCRMVAVPYATLLDLAGDGARSLPRDGDFGPLHGRLLSDRALAKVLERLRSETVAAGPHVGLLAGGLLLQLLAILLRLRDGSRPVRRRGGLAPWQLRRVTDYLLAHLDRDVSLAELAALAGLSPHHFCRAFADSTGSPPHRWLVERRVERAQEMMAADPRLGLTEVALAVGYGSQSAFGTAFRRVTGTTPSAWRRDRAG